MSQLLPRNQQVIVPERDDLLEGHALEGRQPQALKDGAFQLAIRRSSRCCRWRCTRTRSCLQKGSPWLGDATAVVKVLDPVPTKGLTLANLPKLKEDVRNRIDGAVEKLERRAIS